MQAKTSLARIEINLNTEDEYLIVFAYSCWQAARGGRPGGRRGAEAEDRTATEGEAEGAGGEWPNSPTQVLQVTLTFSFTVSKYSSSLFFTRVLTANLLLLPSTGSQKTTPG